MKKTLLLMFQGVTLVTLCFLLPAKQANAAGYTSLAGALAACTQNGLRECNGPSVGSGGGCGTNNHGVFIPVVTYQEYDFCVSGPIWVEGLYPHYDQYYDNEGVSCFTIYQKEFCEGDIGYQEHEGYDEEGCVDGTCPGDSGWRDEEGYDINGFDQNGLDRGGNNAASGGGYGGSAGTGGVAPSYLDTPIPVDPQSGNNRNYIGVLQCQAAYPGFIEIVNSGIYSYDSIACANECQYQYSGTSFDVIANVNVLDYYPTGFPCNGEEPNLNITIGQYIPDSNCYEFGALVHCVDNQSQEKTCYTNDNGNLGYQVQCPPDQTDTTVVNNYCGWANNVYQCFGDSDQCQFFAGQLVCIDPTSYTPIPTNSPDHPLNGGNADGNPNNDLQGENPDNQYQPTLQDQIDEQRLGVAIAENIDARLNDNFQSLNNSLTSVQSQVLIGTTNIQNEVGALRNDLALANNGINNRLDNINLSLNTSDDFDFENIPSGSFDEEGLDSRIETRKQELIDLIDQLEIEAADLVQFAPTETAALPCPSVEVFETNFELCVSDYEEELAPVGTFLLFMAYAFGFFVFTRR